MKNSQTQSKLILSCHNIIETNNGKFKSEKQKVFMHAQADFGVITQAGQTFNVSWVEYFNLDEEGIVSYQRNSNKKGLTTIWERGQITAKQKRKAKHETDLEKHSILAAELYEIYKDACIEKYGYIINSRAIGALHSALQLATITNILRTVNVSEYDSVINEYISHKDEYDMMVAKCQELYDFVASFRILALEKYKSKFAYDFLEPY